MIQALGFGRADSIRVGRRLEQDCLRGRGRAAFDTAAADQAFRAAEADDLPKLVDLFAETFADHPLFAWIAPAHRRARAVALFFEDVIREECLPGGEILVDQEIRGCSIWLPPGVPDANHARRRQTTRLGWMMRVAGPQHAPRLRRFRRAIEHHHPAGALHHSLTYLAVRPSAQGYGLGTRLRRCTLDRLDQLERPAYLEAVGARSCNFYQRLGFSTAGTIALSRGAPEIVQMWRTPRRSDIRQRI